MSATFMVPAPSSLKAVKVADHTWSFVLKDAAPDVTPPPATPTVTTDQIVSGLETAIINDLKRVAMSAIQKKLVSVLTSKLGTLAMGIANPILGFFVGIAINAIVKETDYFAYYLDKDIYNRIEASDVANAALANQQAQANGTPEQQAAAEQALINAAKNLINMNQ